MRQVYTYRSIASLETHPRFDEICHYPQITATGGLLKAMRKRYPQIVALEDIHVIQQGLITAWESPDIAFEQFVNISRIIRTLPVSNEEQVIHGSFVKNKVAVLNAIRLLVEADVEPDDLAPMNMEESLFKRIWEKLELEDYSFTDLRVGLAVYMEEPDAFRTALLRVAPSMAADTIVLHGFYFITPIQERLFDMMENCGINLIFLCCNDDQVPEVGTIWQNVLSTDNKFVPQESWVRDAPIKMLNQQFGSVFGSAPELSPQTHISITRYGSEYDFVQDVSRLLANDYTIFSTDVNTTDELLKEFYPERFKRRHLLSYPVGQFIYRLHSMWNTKEQKLVLSVDDVQACFASGWVEVDGVNGIKHLAGLEGIKTYVSDCKSIDDWEIRLDLLQETKDTVLREFENHIDRMPVENRRWHRLMSDPFLNFSCFNYDDDTLQEIIDLIRHLIHTAKVLFNETGEISINDHLAKVRKLLASGKNEERLLEEERAIIEELSSRLKQPDLGVSKCLPGEISQAIMIIIGGGILDEDKFEVQSGKDDSFIKPLYQIESAPITGSGKVHLCLADEGRLPGRVKSYIWPINNDMLDRLAVPMGTRRHQYLQDMRFVVDSLPLANRYLFYSLLQNQEVELSWISTEDDKTISASPYLQILEKLFHVPVKTYARAEWTAEMVNATPSAEAYLSFAVDLEADAAVESRLDAVICPWRYIYGYVLSVLPAYSSDFHYNFLLSAIIGAISKVANIPKKKAGEAVLSLFPYLRGVEKQQVLDFVPAIPNDDTDAMDDASYPQARLHLHFLRRQILGEAQGALEAQLHVSGVHEADIVNVGSYQLCMYCPHNATCPHGKHDQEEEA